MSSDQKKLFWSSDMVDPKIRDESYREVSSLVYEVSPWDINGDHGFRGSVSSRTFGSMTVGITTFNDQKNWRDRRLVANLSMELYVVQLVLAGHGEGDYNGNTITCKPGDVLIHDLTQVMNAEVTAGARLAVVIPRSDLQRLVPGRNLHGIVLPAEAPTTRLLTEFLIGLDKVLVDLSEDAIPAAEEAFLLLLANAINGESTDQDTIPVNVPMRQRIIDFIDHNIADPRLGLQLIMNHFRLSRSHLYRIFEADDGIATFIRDKRLDLAHRLLSDKKSGRLSNKEIIYRCGLSHNVNFSKIFKERFGILPSEARERTIILPKPRQSATEFHTFLQDHVAKFNEPQDPQDEE